MNITLENIRKKAEELGWDDVGITAAKIPDEEIASYHEWLEAGYQGKLAYMENTMRCAPQELLPGAKTAIIFISYYKQKKLDFREDAGIIASYARGRKYQNVHHRRLKKFIRWLEECSGEKEIAKGFSDSSPVLEKALAVQAGLGWMGKNTLLIHRRFGTFTLLSGLFTTLELPHTTPPKDPTRFPRCGSCQRCLDACPTQALAAPYSLDASKCLSYHLIESKEEIPDDINKQNPGYLFGCDICQDVCPHNVRTPLADSSDFAPESGMGGYLTLEQIEDVEARPEQLHGTPLQRRKAEGLRHTVDQILPSPRSEKTIKKPASSIFASGS